MEFALSDEHRLIGDAAEQFLARHSASPQVREAMASELGHDPELWRAVVRDMGWQGIHLPEDCGGLDLGWSELAVVMEAAGRRLLCAPFFATACMAAPVLLLAASAAQREQWLAPLAAGRTAALAFMDPQGQRWDASATTAVARRSGDGYVLSGELSQVVDGHSAELLLVAVRDGGGALCLFAVPPDSAGGGAAAAADHGSDSSAGGGAARRCRGVGFATPRRVGGSGGACAGTRLDAGDGGAGR